MYLVVLLLILFQHNHDELRIETREIGIFSVSRPVGYEHLFCMIMESGRDAYTYVEINEQLEPVSVLEIKKGQGPGETVIQGDFISISSHKVAALDLLQQKVVVYSKDQSGLWYLSNEFLPKKVEGSHPRLIGYHNDAWYIIYNEPFAPEGQNLLHIHRYDIDNESHERLASIQLPMSTLEMRNLAYRGQPRFWIRNDALFLTWNIFPSVWMVGLDQPDVITIQLDIEPPTTRLTNRISEMANRAPNMERRNTVAPYFHWATVSGMDFWYSRLNVNNHYEIVRYDLETGSNEKVLGLNQGESVLTIRNNYLLLMDRSQDDSHYLIRRNFKGFLQE